MQDNRAFCKYVCPIPVLQKIIFRFSLLKVKIDPERCIECGK
ncbi:MAG TPA: 4Fe-4S binding protein [Desulfitobacterium dehalogenans]|uniref:4Fe-4S binding protein n=1 Tax=Desulfitobacterium dehalogenans TaxID=36854 RepID=A0A7C7D4C0_9FIRM|nr:4Fe-4S binding protein [Desulfitobacterium dehalogenans]